MTVQDQGPFRGDGLLTNIRETRQVFLDHIWPLWSRKLGAERIISTEDSERALELQADFSGTDAFLVRHRNGVLVPLASRIEYFDPVKNNPFNQRYWEHYPRFTIRLGKTRPDGSLNLDVECRKRLLALDDPVARRYLPLFTFQSLVVRREQTYDVLQTSRVRTEDLFEFVRANDLANLRKGAPSKTRREGDRYRIVTVEKLRNAGIWVEVTDRRGRRAEVTKTALP